VAGPRPNRQPAAVPYTLSGILLILPLFAVIFRKEPLVASTGQGNGALAYHRGIGKVREETDFDSLQTSSPGAGPGAQAGPKLEI